jgi:hypothetical protein
MTNKKVSRVQVDLGLCSVEKNLCQYVDVMHVDGFVFVIIVMDPLNLMLQCKIENKGKLALSMGLQGQLV